MKKYLFLSTVGVMMLAACSNDDAVTQDNPDAAQPGSALTISLNNSGDGVGVRASRPTNSSEAANNVTAVKLYVYNSAGVDVTTTALATGTQNPFAWTAGPTTPGIPGTDQTHKASQTVKLNKLSGNGTYTVVAYGYNAIFPAPISDYTISGGTTSADLFTATLPVATTEAELFAGKSTFNVVNGNIEAGTTSEVVLHRHVAGLLAYFKNVPVLYPNPIGGVPTVVAFVRVYASSHGTAFTFPSTGLMNGTVATGTKTQVLEFNLASSITNFAAQVTAAAGTNLLATFNIPAQTGAAVTMPNSVLSGKFLIPFAKTSATTFTVQLEDAASNVLKSWDVVNNALTGDKKIYDVQRNYFYSLGQKNKASSTDGGTTDPGTTGDDDAPIDLSQETVITITVNDAWDMIYNLGIE